MTDLAAPIHAPTPVLAVHRFSGISWGAVFAGALVAIASLIVLAELCAGVGLPMLRPASAPGATPTAGTFALLGVIAWIISTMLSFFLGSWVASHFARRGDATDSTLHGVVVWAVTGVLMVASAATVLGGVIGGAVSLTGSVAHGVGAAAGGAASAVGSAAQGAAQGAVASPQFSWASIQEQAQDLITGSPRQGQSGSAGATATDAQAPASTPSGAADQTALTAAAPAQTAGQAPAQTSGTGATPAMGSHATMGLISRMFSTSDGQRSDADRSQLEAALVSQGHLTREQAHQQVAQWEQAAQQAKQQYDQAVATAEDKARQAAEAAAKFTSLASFVAFAAALLGLGAAALGGHAGFMTSNHHLRGQDRRHGDAGVAPVAAVPGAPARV